MLIKDAKYPIKYALMPIYYQTGYDDFGKYFDVYAYIVSKCYVTGKQEMIMDDGSHEVKYQVIFPFTGYLGGIEMNNTKEFTPLIIKSSILIQNFINFLFFILKLSY